MTLTAKELQMLTAFINEGRIVISAKCTDWFATDRGIDLGFQFQEINMTHIVSSRFTTKKMLKEAIAADPNSVFFEDPSFFSPISGYASEILAIKNRFACTSMPKRAWFAEVMMKNGKIVVT